MMAETVIADDAPILLDILKYRLDEVGPHYGID